MRLEVVAQFAPGQDHGVDQFLDVGVACFGLREHLADEINRSLGGQSVPLFLPLYHYGGADHLGRCGDVEQEGLVDGQGYQDGRIRELCFESVEGFFGLGSLGKTLGFSQESVQRQTFFAEARDESAQGRKASHDPLYSLEVPDWSHASYGRDLLWVGFDAAFRDYES